MTKMADPPDPPQWPNRDEIVRFMADPERCMPSERERLAHLIARHVGFSGTRHGMTIHQKLTVGRLLEPFDWVHHGDCIGSDEQVHDIARLMGKKISVHPPTGIMLRANCVGDENRLPKGYLQRDRDIVNVTIELIVAPKGLTEEARSGTWTTARYARNAGKPVTLVLPDGSCVNWGIPKEARPWSPPEAA